MKGSFTLPLLAAAVLIFTLAAPGFAAAGGYGHGYKRGHGHSYYGHRFRPYGYGYRNYGHRYRPYGYGYRHYGYGHRPYGYGYRHYGYGHRRYGYWPYAGFGFYYARTVAPPPVVVREYRSETVVFDQPTYQAAPPAASGAPSSCVMTREYQTEIAVGGRLVPGYGQACLQPDGSWYRGPAVPAAY